MSMPLPSPNRKTGALMAAAAFTMWGLFPLFFALLRGLPPLHILAHRAVWSGTLSILLVVLFLQKPLLAFWRSPERWRTLGVLALTAALLAGNWGIYIHAVTTGQVLEGSLGYFINPLVNVLLGVVFLKERLEKHQWAGVGLVVLAVLLLAARGPSFPWLAVLLALSFSAYGLLRRQLRLDPLVASCVEALLLAPVALVFLLGAPRPAWGGSVGVNALLMFSGVITLLPLLLFNLGAKHLPYSMLGLLQYVTPTLQFLLAVLAFREPVTGTHAFAFALIWGGLAVSSAPVVRQLIHRRLHPAPANA